MFAKIFVVLSVVQLYPLANVVRSGFHRKNGKSKCEQMRSDSFKKRGSFTPKCNSDGTFKKKQCHYTLVYIRCWKTDKYGSKISNDSFTFLGKPTQQPTVKRPLSKCEKILERRQRGTKKAAVIPTCTKDGHFKREQCTRGKKKCWCVDEQGKRIKGTKVHNGKPKCYPDACGKRFPLSSTRRRRVVGGREAIANTWPWQGLVLFSDHKHICGGTLVKDNWLITAASCFDGYTIRQSEWSVRLGAHDRVTGPNTHDRISVEQVHIHPKYKPGNKTYPGDYDVALIQVSSSANIPKTSWSLCLPNNLSFYQKGARCSITGWGYTSNNGTLANKLREAWVDLVPIDECNARKSYNGVINERFMCAGFKEGGVDACHFDTGGPLACPVEGGVWALAGIISWRQKCAEPHKYGVYTNVHVIKPWIEKTIRS